MKAKTTAFLAITFITALNASDRDKVTMEQYQEAENLLYARTAQQSNVSSFIVSVFKSCVVCSKRVRKMDRCVPCNNGFFNVSS